MTTTTMTMASTMEEWHECDGNVIKLKLKNMGTRGIFLIKDGQDSHAVYNAIVNAVQEFEISGSDVDKSTLNSNRLEVYFSFVFMFDIHVSCSKSIGVGVTFGNYFEVTGGHSKSSGPLCLCEDLRGCKQESSGGSKKTKVSKGCRMGF
jgi:hypothetical protein